MTESHERGRDAPPEARPASAGMFFMLLVFGFGIAAGLLLAFAGTGILDDGAGFVATIFLSAIAVVALVGFLLFVLRRPILRRITGVAETQIEGFARPLAKVAESAIAGDPAGATGAAREFAQLALARYGWIATRRWIVAALTGLIAAMAALAGTALLFKQNELLGAQTMLLEQQNDKIETQTALLSQDVQLAEAARNAALAVEITTIAGLVGEAASLAAASQAEGGGQQDPIDAMVNVLDPVTDLGRGLMLRIVSASRAARPYRFLETGLLPDDANDKMRVAMARRQEDLPKTVARMSGVFGWSDAGAADRLIDRPTSPERGQLLQVLMSGGLRNLEVLNHFGLDLSFANMPNGDIILLTAQGGRLAYSDFSGSHLRNADLGGAMLENARFRRATIIGSDFSVVEAGRVRAPFRTADAPFPSFLQGTDFAGAVIMDSSFRGAYLTAANLDGALVLRADFSGAVLAASTMRGAVLLAPVLDGADLKSADLDGAILFGEDVIGDLGGRAAEGTFEGRRYRADPVPLAEVMALPIVFRTLTEEEVTAATGGAPAYRLARTLPFEDDAAQ